MAANDDLGNLSVSITGDFSELESAITGAVGKAEDGAQAIQAALTVPSAGDGLAQAFTNIGDAAGPASGQLDLFGEAAHTATAQLELFEGFTPSLSEGIGGVGDAAGSAVAPVESFGGAAQHAGQEAHEAESGLAGMAEQFAALAEALVITEGLKEFGQEALRAFGTVQSVTIGLTQMTGSAEKAEEIIRQVKELAATEPFAFPELAPTIQKMVALGVSAEAIPGVMHAVADAASATGNSFQAIANSFDRMALSGVANTRQLTQLGLSTKDLGAVMGVTADQVKTAFAALDQTTRIQILEAALVKFAGSAEAQAKGIAGQWQIFQNQFEEVMVGIGEALAPVVGDILSFGKAALSGLQSATAAFNSMSQPVKDVVVVVGLLAAATAPLAAAISAIGFAIIGFNTAWTTGAAILQRFAGSAGEAAIANEALAVSARVATVAEEAQAVATTELVAAQQGIAGSAAAASTAGSALGLVTASLALVATAAAGVYAGWELGKWAAESDGAKVAVTEMTAGMGAWGIQSEQTKILLKDLVAQFPPLVDAAKNATGAVKDLGDGLRILTAPFDAVVKKQMDAVSSSNQLHVAYELAKLAVDNARKGVGDLSIALQTQQRAYVEWQAAVDASTAHTKDWSDTLAGITQKLGESRATFSTLASVFGQLATSTDGSARSTALLADVYGHLESLAKSSGVAFADYRGIMAQVEGTTAQNYATFQQLGAAYGSFLSQQKEGRDVTAQLVQVYKEWQAAGGKVGETIATAAGEMAKFLQAAQGQKTTLDAVAGAFRDLAAVQQPSIDQQIALQAAFKALTADASAMGLQVDVAGNSLVFTAKAGVEATPALIAYRDRLNEIFTNAANLVNIDGKLTAASLSLTGAFNNLGTTATTAAKATTAVATAAQQTGTLIVDLNRSVSDGGIYWLNYGNSAGTAAKGIHAAKDAAQGGGALIVDLNKSVSDGSIHWLSYADAANMTSKVVNMGAGGLGYQVSALGDAVQKSSGEVKHFGVEVMDSGRVVGTAIVGIQGLSDESYDLTSRIHTTADSIAAFTTKGITAAGVVEDVAVKMQGLSDETPGLTGHFKDFSSAATQASDEVENLDGSVQQFTADAPAVVSAADDIASGYSSIASAAYDAATAVNSLAAADAAGGAGSGLGKGSMGSVGNAEGYLALMASMGASNFDLDQAAQGFGLVPVGNRQYVTKDEFIKMTGGILHVDGSGHLVGNAGAPMPWQKTLNQNPTTAGNAPAASTSSSSSGVTALASSAGQAATAVSGLGSASSSAATPLGAFTSNATLAAEAAANLSKTIPTVTIAIKGTADDLAKAFSTVGHVADNLGLVDTGATNAGRSLYTLTQIVNGQVYATTNTADALFNLGQAAAAAADSIQSSGGFVDGLSQANTAIGSTTNAASDYFTAQEKATGAVDSATQKYDQALASSINAQNAYTNALHSGTATANDLWKLQQASQDAQAALTALSGVLKGQELGGAVTTSGIGSTTAMPVDKPQGVSDPQNTGGWEWDQSQKKWVWNPNQHSIQGPTGVGTANWRGAANPNIPTGGPNINTSQPGLVGAGQPGITINVNLTTGPVVGTNAANILTDALAPQLVAKLRQAGAKL